MPGRRGRRLQMMTRNDDPRVVECEGGCYVDLRGRDGRRLGAFGRMDRTGNPRWSITAGRGRGWSHGRMGSGCSSGIGPGVGSRIFDGGYDDDETGRK